MAPSQHAVVLSLQYDENTAYYPVFPLAESWLRPFAGYAFRTSKRLCHRKWLMLFSLKFHRDNRQNALALYSA
ncbi:hypothetical protein, partial [uncultured Bilophila sp.]|uniref:hypothetical protein n=1 Tax=uncultured Bilophila sp. TaxID=529385 RepID=UPI00280B0D51